MKYKLLFWVVVILHHCFLWSLVAGVVLSCLYQPWYIAVLYTTVVLRIATIPTPPGMKDLCVLSQAEVKLRERLGYKPLKGFVKQYYILPCRVAWGKVKTLSQRLLNAFKHG